MIYNGWTLKTHEQTDGQPFGCTARRETDTAVYVIKCDGETAEEAIAAMRRRIDERAALEACA